MYCDPMCKISKYLVKGYKKYSSFYQEGGFWLKKGPICVSKKSLFFTKMIIALECRE